MNDIHRFSIYRGHIGIQGFHYILNDTRFQDIPLILETPSFEKPEVWATEIAALDGLSGARADELGAVVDGIKDVAKKAAAGGITSAAKTKTKKAPPKKPKAPPKKGKGRKKAKQEDEDSGDDYVE